MRRLLALKLFAFVALGLGAVLGADLGQAIAESFLVPQEDAMHARVNQVRSSRGLDSVRNDTALRWMARRQSQAMASQGYIFHNQNLASDADSSGLPWYTLGENVGRGPESDQIQAAFESSPTHLQNIVNGRFNALGVGGLADPDQTLYFTQNYAGLEEAAVPPPPPPPDTAPPAPAAPPPTAPGTTPEPTAPPAPVSSPDTTSEPEPVSADTEVQSSDVDEQPVASSEGTRPQRPSLIRVLLSMFAVLADKLSFWN